MTIGKRPPQPNVEVVREVRVRDLSEIGGICRNERLHGELLNGRPGVSLERHGRDAEWQQSELR